MIGGWAATIEVSVSPEYVRMVGEAAAQVYVSERHIGDWFVRGPRGGRYIADAAQVTIWQLDKDGFFHQDRWRYLGHRKHLRYVRPGSRDAGRFDGSGSELGSESPDSASPTHETTNTAGIGSG